MIKWLLSICILFCVSCIMAHQTDVSSTMLVEQADGTWVLQIGATMTAFQYEVIAQHGENAYDSPEQFKTLVVNHLKDNLSIYFNDQDPVELGQGRVKLGHETNVIFEVLGVPEEVKSIKVKNSSFKDIQRNQSTLLVLKTGFPKEQFVLNEENKHTLKLLVIDSKFVAQGKVVRASMVTSPT